MVDRAAWQLQGGAQFAEPKPAGLLGKQVYDLESFIERAESHKFYIMKIDFKYNCCRLAVNIFSRRPTGFGGKRLEFF
jgi:hypothetical protein